MVEVSGYNRAVKVSILCSLWYFLSSYNNVINKRFLGSYPYPVTLSLSHMTATSFLMYPVLMGFGIRTTVDLPFWRFYMMLIPLGVGKLLVSIASHMSIWKIPVSYAHTVKATMPVFTVIVTRLVFKETQTIMTYFSLLPIIIGVGIATITELSFDLFGMAMAIFATLVFALQNLYTKEAIKNLRLNHLHLLTRIAHISFVIVVPVWILTDSQNIFRDENLTFYDNRVDFISKIALSGLVNFAQNIMAFSVLNLLTPLSYSVASATKRVLVIAVSIVTLKNPVTVFNLIGMMLAVFGVFLYNRTKYLQRQKRLAATILPYTTDKASDLQHPNGRLRVNTNGRTHSYI